MSDGAPRFARLAVRARRHLALAEGLRLAAASGPWLLAVIAAAGVLALAGVHLGRWPALAVPAWLAGVALVAWSRRPGAAAALARWDAAAGRADGFLNAWDFERTGAAGTFAAHHRERMSALAEGAAPGRDLPLWRPGARRRIALAPAACLALALAGAWLPTAPPVDAQLAAEERGRFAAEAARLAEEAARLEQAAGLTAAEKTAAKDLADRLAAATAEAERKGLTGRDALLAMDRIARDAEKLADALGDAPQASAALLEELAKGADTAALAEALRAGDLSKAAAAAEALAAKASAAGTSLDEQRRLAEALAKAASAAEAAGDRGAIAETLRKAAEALREGKRGEAGKQLAALGGTLGAAATRERTRQQVQRLAQQLRAGGGTMLAKAAPPGQRSSAPVSNQPFTPNARPSSMPTPGARPGQSAGGKPGGSGAGGSGSCPGGGSTPVPGSKPGSGSGDGAGGGAGAGAGATPVPGVGLASTRGRGGTRAGRGHQDSSMAPSTVRPSRDAGTVDAAPGSGDSTTRTVSGDGHDEASALAATRTPAQLIDAEEKALDAEPIPLARREQVKRYFALLRASADRLDGKE